MLWFKPNVAKLLTRKNIAGLGSALSFSDPKVRQEAARALGEVGEASAADLLVTALADEETDVREAAATSLGRLGSNRAVAGLCDALRDDTPQVRQAAASALGQLKQQEAAGALQSALEDVEREVSRAAAEALIAVGGDEALWGHAWLLASGEQAGERAKDALASAGEQSLPALLAALVSTDAAVRGGAADALRGLACEACVEPLSKALQDSDPGVRAKAVLALAAIGSTRAVEALCKALSGGPNDVQVEVAKSLGDVGGSRAVEGLCDALWEASPEVGTAADKALRKLGEEALATEIVRILQDEEAPVTRPEDPRLTQALGRALQRGGLEVRRAAVEALGGVSDPQASEALAFALGDRDPVVQETAAGLLGQMGIATEKAFVKDRDVEGRGGINSVAFSVNGDLFAYVDGNAEIHLWETTDWNLLRTMDGPRCGHCRIAYSPSAAVVACVGGVQGKTGSEWTGQIWLFDANSGEWKCRLAGHDRDASCVAFSKDGRFLASGGDDQTAKVWQVPVGRASGEPRRLVTSSLRTLEGHEGSVTSVAFSPDGKVLATGSYSELFLWNTGTGERLRSLDGHKGFIRALAFSPTGNTLASIGDDGYVRLWDLKVGKPQWTIRVSPEGRAVSFSPDGKMIAADGGVYAAEDGHLLQMLSDQSVKASSFSPDGTVVAVGVGSNIELWRLALRVKTG